LFCRNFGVIVTRRLQRVLFRMQLDPAFAAAVASGRETGGLGQEELLLLRSSDPAAVAADHLGRRRAQVLGNIASEYVLMLAEAARGSLGPGFLHEFPASDHFHRAIAEERRLPEAFGAWARARAGAAGEGVAAALAVLEAAMALARREERPAAAPGRGEVALSARAWLVALPDGTFAHAQALRGALDADEEAPPAEPELAARARKWLETGAEGASDAAAPIETVLLLVDERSEGHRLREVAPERLDSDVAKLLLAATAPLDAARRAALAAELDQSLESVENFVAELVSDGVLRRG
jgi:hypothetical protein